MNEISDIEKHIDGLRPEGRRRGMRRTTKIGLAVLISTVLIVSVYAGLLPYINELTAEVNVEQAVKLDGHEYDDPIIEQFDAIGGCCYCFEHEVTNDGCQGVWLDWTHTGDPDLEGIDINMKETEPDCCNHILETLEMSVLDGQAQWDNFDVYVDGIPVYSYQAVGGTETWIAHVIDLTNEQIPCCGTHVITIDCTAGQPWQYFNPYGELAVDTIALYCEGHILCDSVDIGKTASEAGHNLQGWGPIEPATHGGNYGGIDDCRCTWFWTQGDVLPPNDPWSTTDTSEASLELTCADCYEPDTGCDCEDPCMEMPFYLDAGETLNFCLCYKFDPFVTPGEYIITSKLIPALEPQE